MLDQDWNVTELPYNGSLHWEASNASEHREDPAESIELDGNLSDRTLVEKPPVFEVFCAAFPEFAICVLTPKRP